ncbi:MAG: biotin--[acetyl-CoA-carboxylase] ligase [Gammaproteobacteria bacterium]|nr:MAG: biotin--[acetyl-CoA-carboxylase] ligase [Gammaproteobacteria bacterium]
MAPDLTLQRVADLRRGIISTLADGKFHSGAVLAETFGLSRTAIWKQIHSLAAYGLEVYTVPGRGYRIAEPLELLDRNAIISALSDAWFKKHGTIEVNFETDSTNHRLMQRLPGADIHAQALMAEFQSAGRGRRGTTWVSPFASGIILSLGWRFESTPQAVAALSLAAGVAVADALSQSAGLVTRLKWPNDILCLGGKIGGILIESRGETTGPFNVVIGVGVNVGLSDGVIRAIRQPVTDVRRNASRDFTRNQLAADLIGSLASMLRRFERYGFKSFINSWRELDYFQGKEAELIFADRKVRGTVEGIDDNGLLIMDLQGKRQSFSHGELSLRLGV